MPPPPNPFRKKGMSWTLLMLSDFAHDFGKIRKLIDLDVRAGWVA